MLSLSCVVLAVRSLLASCCRLTHRVMLESWKGLKQHKGPTCETAPIAVERLYQQLSLTYPKYEQP
ncbi:hypothetical protein CI610_02735 [invertebrate metagenome]|uniref:Uncharacterized protein n=1 Tax=invertebrate metagenome TaxID=1711999 RepID=A0A2H9T552_9ZZZZ